MLAKRSGAITENAPQLELEKFEDPEVWVLYFFAL